MKRYCARWVVPVTSAPIENGCVVEEDGVITFVGAAGAATGGDAIDFGDAVILPGLVNTHTHLELTSMRGFLEDLCFNDWIEKLRASRKHALTDEMLLDSARLGIREGLHSGITTFADTGASGVVLTAMLELGVRGIVFHETFGSDPAQCDASIAALRQQAGELARLQTDLVSVGISPHAPYTVSDALYTATADLARSEGYRMALHISESRAELDLVRHGTGDFANEWRERSLEVVPRGRSPVELLERTGCLDGAPLLIHCVQLDAEDIETMRAHGCSVAHCPASNAKFGHGIAPLVELLEAGITVGLGSDSVASNNRMDILEEARLAALFQRAARQSERVIPARQALELATIGGARALGLESRVGSLEAGKDADIAVFSLDAARVTPVGDIVAALMFAVAGADAEFVAVRGRPLIVGRKPTHLDDALADRVKSAAGALRDWESAQVLDRLSSVSGAG